MKEAAGILTSSTTAEAAGMAAGLERLLAEPAELAASSAVLVHSDSRALVARLQRLPHLAPDSFTARAQSALYRLASSVPVTVCWVPGHAGIAGNERADREAGAAAALPQDGIAIGIGPVKALLRREEETKWIEAVRASCEAHGGGGDGDGGAAQQPPSCYWRASAGGKRPDVSGLSRSERRSLHQLRADRCPRLAYTRHLYGLQPSSLCQRCGTGAIDNTEHFLLQCSAHDPERVAILGTNPQLDILQFRPKDVLEFYERVWRR